MPNSYEGIDVHRMANGMDLEGVFHELVEVGHHFTTDGKVELDMQGTHRI